MVYGIEQWHSHKNEMSWVRDITRLQSFKVSKAFNTVLAQVSKDAIYSVDERFFTKCSMKVAFDSFTPLNRLVKTSFMSPTLFFAH